MKKRIFLAFIFAIIATCCLVLAACGDESSKTEQLTLKNQQVSYEIDVYETTYVTVALPELFNETLTGLSYEVTSSSTHITLSRVTSEGKFNVISDGETGDFDVAVTVNKDSEQLLNFTIIITVNDGAPAPTLKKNIGDIQFKAPIFPHASEGRTYVEYELDLSQYFDAASNITYAMDCTDTSVSMTADEVKPYMVTLIFTSVGEKDITVSAVQKGEKKVSSTFKVKLEYDAPNKLINGGFEDGLTGWDLDSWARSAYAIYNNNVDIWGNGIDNDGNYIYGYYNESGTCEFTSSVFTLGGTGHITWKMAGNCTDDLQFVLMKYVENGEDVEITKFNNWYYGKYAGSGFIFRQYYYQAESSLIGSKCYFKVIDNRSEDFGFVNLDSIETYYSSVPDTTYMYKAGFLNDPDGKDLDMSDTSATPFPTDLSTVDYQLVNGDFEDGYTGWYMSAAEKKAYSINGSKTDIWNNPVNATNNYLYGYANESFASANFHSSLFKVGGTGLITWKMAGNSTEDLQFILMEYNPDGEDKEIAKFNNWYFPISNESGFIFRNYYYQIDMDKYEGSYCYFIVKDNKTDTFGFICLDDIVTYYTTTPTLEGEWFKAGFVKDPDAE